MRIHLVRAGVHADDFVVLSPIDIKLPVVSGNPKFQTAARLDRGNYVQALRVYDSETV